MSEKRGQGALEYLLLIAGAVLVAAVVIYLLSTMAATGQTEVTEGMGEIEGGLSQLEALATGGGVTETGNFEINGTAVTPFSGTETYLDYYGYDFSEASSLSLAQESGQALFYLYQKEASDRVGIAIVLDKQDDGSGGNLNLTVTGDAEKGIVVVKDDSSEMSKDSSKIEGVWSWSSCCTDGGLFTMPNNESWSLNFEIITPNGISEKYFEHANGRETIGNSFTLSYDYVPGTP